MKRHTYSICFLLALVACPQIEQQTPQVPAEVAYAVALTLDKAGQVVSLSPLRPWAQMDSLYAQAGGEQKVVVFGYSAAQLGLQPGQELNEQQLKQRIHLSQECEAPLPAPLFAWPKEQASIPLHLSVDWYSNSCTVAEGAQLYIDTTCSSEDCALPMAPGQCQVRLYGGECGLKQSTAHIWPTGEICLVLDQELATANQCVPARFPQRQQELFSHVCEEPERCRIDLRLSSNEGGTPFEIDRVRFGKSGYTPRLLVSTNQLDVSQLRIGYGLSMVEFDEEILVLHRKNKPLADCATERGLERIYGSFYSKDTLELTRTATVPGCLQANQRLPQSESLVAPYVENDEWKLGIFDKNLAVTSSVVLPVGEGNYWDYSADAVIYFEESQRILTVLYGHEESWVSIHSLPGFRLEHRFATDHRARLRSFALANKTQAVFSGSMARLNWIDVELGEPVKNVSLSLQDNAWHFILAIAALKDHQGGGLLLAYKDLVSGRLYYQDSSQQLSWARSYPQASTPTALAYWDRQQLGDILVAGVRTRSTVGRDIEREAVVSFFEPGFKRYRPGAWKIGRGVVSEALIDTAGRAWLLLSWEGELVRLTAK